MTHPPVQPGWKRRQRIHRKAKRLFALAARNISPTGSRNGFYSAGDLLRLESDRLYVMADLEYAHAVVAEFGPRAVIDWVKGNVETT